MSQMYCPKGSLKILLFLTILHVLHLGCEHAVEKESDERTTAYSTTCTKEPFTQGQKLLLPSFEAVAEDITYGDEPMVYKQLYLNNSGGIDINIVPAWDKGYGRKPISVAVIDTPVDTTHPDLQNVEYVEVEGFHVAHTNSHGTKVAGVLGAQDNGIGIIGVVPHARIYSYGLSGSLEPFPKILTENHREIAVYNASIGIDRNTLIMYYEIQPEVKQAIDTITRDGFYGRGSSMVFAAGNANLDSTNDGHLHHHAVISANAISMDGGLEKPKIAGGFTYGENLWITAPMAEFTTTTDSEQPYTTDFRQTSSAAPLVSGAVALLRSEYPKLTWRDVKLLVAESANRYDSESKAQYIKSGAKYFDGSEQQYSRRLGFGLLDVDKMLSMAQDWKALPSMKSISCVEESTSITQKSFAMALMVENSDIAFIESVTLKLIPQTTDTETFLGRWRVSLTSPNGVMRYFYLQFFESGMTVTLLFNSFLGSSYVNGAWNLEIERPTTEKVSLRGVRITIRGH